jgi:hypothetical protein
MLNAAPTRQAGFMAIVLVVFLVVFTAMAAAIVSMSTSGARGGADHANAAGALFMAESGIEWAARELFDTADPATDCNALAANTPATNVNGGGSFDITESNYDTTDGSCRLTSIGMVNQTRRVLKGNIPASVLDGDAGGGDDLFEDSDEKFNNCNQQNLECQDGAMTFQRPSGGPGQGNTNTRAKASDLITDDFEAGDTVYFTANFEWDTTDVPTGNRFNIELTNNIADCDVFLPDLNSPCAAPGADPLYDLYDVVLILGDSFAADSINQVDLTVGWGNNQSDWIALSEGCIGRAGHCAGEGSDDPIDDGTWDEDP